MKRRAKRDPSILDVPQARAAAGSNQELKMAERLVQTMVGEWRPEKYRDEYRQDLLDLIDKKVRSRQTKTIEPVETAPSQKPQSKVIDIMHLLRKSVEEVDGKEPSTRRRRAS
jgi:DNA end-binding protein Ku